MLVLLLHCLLILGYKPKKLDQKIVVEIIKREFDYSGLSDYDIYCNDPKYVRKLEGIVLERGGFLVIEQKQKLIDIKKPVVSFTEKVKTYLLSTSEKDRPIGI